jgi:hypothetical protein
MTPAIVSSSVPNRRRAALDFLGQHHVVVRDVGHDEGAHLALVALPTVPGCPPASRQQVQHAVLLLDEDLAEAHRLDRKQVELTPAGRSGWAGG